MIIVSNLKFEKIRQIGVGQGLNSTVWLAYDHQFNCELAIKEIDKTTFWNPDCFAEAQAVYAVAHPNVVGVQYGSEEGTSAYIAMPFYPNGSLSNLLSLGPIQLSAVLSMAHGILLGLEHIHITGFIHLDIKPSNIFFDNLNRPLIADFGQSRKIGTGGVVTAPDMYCKTMPPEVLMSGNAAPVSDIYHVGALLYRALNGEEEWLSQLAKFTTNKALETAIKNGRFPNRDKFLPHVPKRLRTVLRKALSVEPTERFSSASDFAAQLGKVLLVNDWTVITRPCGSAVWRSSPATSADLVVEMEQGKTGWETRIYTENAGNRRAKSKSSLWGRFPDRDAALKDLKRIFELL